MYDIPGKSAPLLPPPPKDCIGPMIGVATMHVVGEIFGNGVNTGGLEKTAQFLGGALMIVAVPWFIARGAYGYGRMKRVRARQYYLRNFKALHARQGAEFNWSAAMFWLWPAFRGMFAWSCGLCVLLAAFVWLDVFLHHGAMPSWYRGMRIALVIGLFVGIGMMATRIYFRHAIRAVAMVLALPKEEALKKLQQSGGTYGWVMPIMIVALLYVAQLILG